MINTLYNPYNWYWTVGNNAEKVFSSAVSDYVSIRDQAFLAWVTQGNRATVIDTEENLFDVLWPYGLEGPKTARNHRAKKLNEAEASAKIADLEARLKSLEAAR